MRNDCLLIDCENYLLTSTIAQIGPTRRNSSGSSNENRSGSANGRRKQRSASGKRTKQIKTAKKVALLMRKLSSLTSELTGVLNEIEEGGVMACGSAGQTYHC